MNSTTRASRSINNNNDNNGLLSNASMQCVFERHLKDLGKPTKGKNAINTNFN